ncbi:hypothetical protein KKP3000_003176 [Alicyclobacillus fastidiosus]|uniref:Uncharacterized protein n=1 Tax=Alicyclobacillus fastidiosus TaxID=392011 RepID=A0ABV5ABZ3_9BACL
MIATIIGLHDVVLENYEQQDQWNHDDSDGGKQLPIAIVFSVEGKQSAC